MAHPQRLRETLSAAESVHSHRPREHSHRPRETLSADESVHPQRPGENLSAVESVHSHQPRVFLSVVDGVHPEFKASDPIFNKSTCLNFATVNPETNQGIYVYYSDEKSVGIKTMRESLESGILIYSQAMTPSANKVIASMAQQFTLEAFQEAKLLVNITRHIMVPKHEVMKPEEKKALLAR
ncbi:DNA-directed RNA polymerases II 24 kDa polypeptide (RNA polymerase II subunit 5) [Puccinia graminis f. sp. tritici]|uniref:DNA-directed RNA polymerases II 24 kDa polypeptide (RNA polymerase II subunit 5) n=1 Tax=Puccinia graminis f. sp. tritici TaxID=56615 RepID=A0A5B0MYL3_PUCGR|nr:DNA-directed RNA polymerases II 24 kDa polypeptide (RNA polymerase II subunit 5) [Puccinia graminis f. sp. tritici]